MNKSTCVNGPCGKTEFNLQVLCEGVCDWKPEMSGFYETVIDPMGVSTF